MENFESIIYCSYCRELAEYFYEDENIALRFFKGEAAGRYNHSALCSRHEELRVNQVYSGYSQRPVSRQEYIIGWVMRA